MQRLRVLLIDDEPRLRKTVAALLGKEHEVVEAGDGQEALDVLRSEPTFDAILCDLRMPGMAGTEVYEAICAQNPEMARRFALLTGGTFTPPLKRLVDSGNITVLTKPCGRRELLDTIETLAAGGATS